jgi:hypothetical protein
LTCKSSALFTMDFRFFQAYWIYFIYKFSPLYWKHDLHFFQSAGWMLSCRGSSKKVLPSSFPFFSSTKFGLTQTSLRKFCSACFSFTTSRGKNKWDNFCFNLITIGNLLGLSKEIKERYNYFSDFFVN